VSTVHPAPDPEPMNGSTLNGDDVVNYKGEVLGKIKEVLLDSHNGRAAYAVLSFGSFLGMGEKHFAVPWNSLKLDAEHKGFVLNLAKDQLKNMPWVMTRKGNPIWQTRSGIRAFVSTKSPSRRTNPELFRYADPL
jgi:sporulation protein YlmC with PRC-barrel domain